MSSAAVGPRRAIALVAGLVLSFGALVGVSSATSAADAAAAPSGTDPKIVGGSSASAATYPWFAQLQIQTQEGTFGCGGALVTPVVVLTAAHCVDGYQNGVAAFGQDQTGLGGQVVGSVAAITAADYSKQNLDNDYGFLFLAQPVTAYPIIKLAGPAETALWRAGRVGSAMGFGHVSEGGAASPTLQHVALPVLSDAVCGAAASYATAFRPASMLCVGYPEGGRATCQGDSGGPFAVPGDGGVWRIAGLVSWANGCARPGFPSVFTRAGDPAYSGRIQQRLNDVKAQYPQLFPGVYSDTNIIGAGAVPPGCGAAQAAAGGAAAAAAKTDKKLKSAKANLKKAVKRLQNAKQIKGKKERDAAVKAANAAVAKAGKGLKKAKKKDKAAEQAAAAAGAAASATCS